MFAATIFVLIVFSLCENEVQCSTIRRQVFSRETQNLTKPTKHVTFLKKIDNAVIQNPLEVSALLASQREINLSGEREVKEADRVTISKGKNRLTKNDAKRRKPKFLGSLTFAKLLNGAIALNYLTPGYFTTLYGPQSYFPYLYPVPYPVPGIGSNFFPNFPSGIPTKPPSDRIVTSVPLSKPVPQQISNLSAPVELQVVDTTLDNDKVTTEKEDDAASDLQEQAVDDAEKEISEAQATQVDLKRAVPSDVKDELDTDPIVESVINDGQELGKLSLTRKTSTPTPTSTSTTTTVSTTDVPTNTTTVPNVTLSTTSAGNGTQLSPFHGYYGGMPQDLEHLLFTTENPQQRYLDDYNPEKFALPFQRPATFNPYPNAEAYPSPFVNSFSPRERFPEFLNTVEADRYFYDSQNKPNFDGFRPILK